MLWLDTSFPEDRAASILNHENKEFYNLGLK
jgi:hypothetical protein